MKNQGKDQCDVEILKTARDMLKAYVQSNPDSIRGADPDAVLELHKRFFDGLKAQVTAARPEEPDKQDQVLIVYNAKKPEPIAGEVVEEGAPVT